MLRKQERDICASGKEYVWAIVEWRGVLKKAPLDWCCFGVKKIGAAIAAPDGTRWV